MAEPPRSALVARYWRQRVIGTVDHVEVNERVHDDAGWSAHYLFMTVMSAGIAVLGLLLSSPAVVIGAMLISPLMGPIIGLGFALATVDARQIRRAAFALAAGSLLAVLFTAAIVLASPIQNVTSEIAARTKPNLFDLLVALFSALAGAYATIRGRAGTIVGVAIATALMPPLATVGFGLATWNGAVFSGALLLFVTNFVTIALAATIMARLYGFGSSLSPNQTALQLALVIGTTAILAVPLGLSLRKLALEGIAGTAVRQEVAAVFGKEARVSQVDLDYSRDPITATAVVLTPVLHADAAHRADAALTKRLGRPIRVTIQQYRVGTEQGDAAAAEVKAAQANAAPSPVDSEASKVAARVAAIAGVDRSAILVDQVARRVRATAALLPGASLATYRALETRAAQPGWDVQLVPPPLAPDKIAFVDGKPDQNALDSVAWAARRLGYAAIVAGSAAQDDAVIDALTAQGVRASRAQGTGPAGGVGVRWDVPAS